MASKDLKRALFATLFFGAASGIFIATLNNYLSEVHSLGAEARGWLELPRELPGFLIMFVAGAMLTVFRETQMAAAAMLLTALGAVGLGFLTPNHAALVVFIVIWSLGDHIIFAVEGPIGLKLAKGGKEGRRLGQFGGARNLGTIADGRASKIFLPMEMSGILGSVGAIGELFRGDDEGDGVRRSADRQPSPGQM